MTVNQQVREIIDYAEKKIKRVANIEVNLYPRPKQGIAWFTWDQLCVIVCEALDVDLNFVMSKWRKSEIVLARHLIWYYAVIYKMSTLTDIGARLNHDHTSVIHAVTKVKGLLETGDEKVYDAVAKIDIKLEALKTTEPET